jgi:hypothetical protein
MDISVPKAEEEAIPRVGAQRVGKRIQGGKVSLQFKGVVTRQEQREMEERQDFFFDF